MELSIIVPVYNGESFIFRCLNSLIKQNLQDYEVIIVDDGSIDKTFVIAELFCKEHNQFKIYKTENRGVSAARNYGFQKSSGNYVYFCDSDDCLEENQLLYIFNKLRSNNLDICIFGINQYLNGVKIEIEHSGSFKLLEKRDALHSILNSSNIAGYACNKIFKRGVVQDIFFDENIRLEEDKLFCINAVHNAEKIGFYDIPAYNYYLTDNGATRQCLNLAKYTVIESKEKQLAAINKDEDGKDNYDIILSDLISCYCFFFFNLKRLDKDSRKYWKKRILFGFKINRKIKVFNYLSHRRRIAFIYLFFRTLFVSKKEAPR